MYQVLRLNGCQTEGIFRVSADVDEVNSLKNKLDKWELPELSSSMGTFYLIYSFVNSYFVYYLQILDAHAPASLLKLWYRELYEPLIPDILYHECVTTETPQHANDIVNRLPTLNRLVIIISLTSISHVYKLYAVSHFFLFTGAYIPCTFFAIILSARSCGKYKDGFSKFGYGICTQLFKMHIIRSSNNIRKRKKRNGIYADANTAS